MPGFTKGNVPHTLKKYFLSRRPANGLRGARLLHDNASSHKRAIVREYLKQENVVELPYPPYSPDLSPCDSRLKKTPPWKKTSSAQNLGLAFFSV